MTDVQTIALVAVAAPLTVVVLTGLVRGYHVKFRMYRPNRKDRRHGPPDA